MDTLIIELARDNTCGNLKRLLIKSMNQGYNCYPNIKAAAYTMLWKYSPERINNKNDSTTMRSRPATGVSFYQQDTPIYRLPERTNWITEDMIAF